MDVIKQHIGVRALIVFDIAVRFPFGLLKMCSSRGAGKIIPKIVRIPKCLYLTVYIMISLITMCKVIAKNTPDAFKRIPDLFWRAPKPENRV